MALAGMEDIVKPLLIITGFISLFVAAVFVVRIGNYKRILAYSSIENIGIIAIALGIGGWGNYAAMLHVAGHSLAKAAFFLTSGVIYRRYKTKDSGEIRGLLKADPAAGWLWIACFAAISGFPPFPLFISEFLIIRSMASSGHYGLMALFFILLTIIMTGIGRVVFRMSFGGSEGPLPGERPGLASYAPQALFILILTVMGISIPGFLLAVLNGAAAGL